jgi:hypothetical protein
VKTQITLLFEVLVVLVDPIFILIIAINFNSSENNVCSWDIVISTKAISV